MSLTGTNNGTGIVVRDTTPGTVHAGESGGVDGGSIRALGRAGVKVAAAAVNWKKSNTSQIRSALAGAFAGDFRSRFLFPGDSALAATGSDNNGLVGARAKGWIAQLAAMLTAAGYRADENWSMGMGGNASLATLATYDPRLAFGSAMTINTGYPGIGGGGGWSTGTDTTNGFVTHTPRKACDTADILTMRSTGTGSYTVKDQAAVTAGTISTNGANGVIESTQAMPGGTTAVKLTTTGTNCLIYGVGTRVAASPGIEMINCGVSGQDLAYQTVNPATGNNFCHVRASLPVLMTSATKNVVFLNGGYNDINSFGKNLDQVATSLRSQLTFLKSLSVVPDIVWMGYPRLVAGPGAGAAQVDFDLLYDTCQKIAVNEFDVCAIDQRAVLEDSATAIALGLMASDGLHNRAGGQSMTAKMVFDALMLSLAD